MGDYQNIEFDDRDAVYAQKKLENTERSTTASHTRVVDSAERQNQSKWANMQVTHEPLQQTSALMRNSAAHLQWLSSTIREFVDLVEDTKRDFNAADERGQEAMLNLLNRLGGDALDRYETAPHRASAVSTPFPTCPA